MDLVLARFPALSPSARAILLMLCTVLCFSVLETTAKYLTRFYPVPQVVWGRYTVHLVLMLVLLGPRMRLNLVRTSQPAEGSRRDGGRAAGPSRLEPGHALHLA